MKKVFTFTFFKQEKNLKNMKKKKKTLSEKRYTNI